jgi:hypothetical protein
LPTKKLLLGQLLDRVLNLDAVKSRERLDYFVAFAGDLNRAANVAT